MTPGFRMMMMMMIAATLFLCGPVEGLAQSGTAVGGLSVTGHGAFRLTRLYEDGATLAGGGIGLMLGAKTRIEISGFTPVSPSSYGTLEFRVAYVGIRLEREIWRSGQFVTSAALLGGGGEFWTKETLIDQELRTGIAVVEPELLAGFDLGNHANVALTVSYRRVTGIEGDILNRSDGDARHPSLGVRLAVR